MRFGADGHGRDEPEYPAEAVRELVANALVHRDLGPHALSQRVTVTLEHNRLVVANPGGLWGLTVEQLGRFHGGSARNQSLYDICKDTRTTGDRRVIEGIGTGIESVRNALARAGLTAPHFIDSAIRFTALVPNHALLDDSDLEWLSSLEGTTGLGDVQRHVLVGMRRGVEWTNRSLRDMFPMDSTEARALLTDLVERGLAEAIGERGARAYRLDAQAEFPRSSRTAPLWEGSAGPTGVVRPRPGTIGKESGAQIAASPGAEGLTRALPRHGETILEHLRGGQRTRAQLTRLTGLSDRQVSYTLETLRDLGIVETDGGQGDKTTSYHLVDRETAEDLRSEDGGATAHE